jgi:hypothetical protein
MDIDVNTDVRLVVYAGRTAHSNASLAKGEKMLAKRNDRAGGKFFSATPENPMETEHAGADTIPAE